MAADDIIYIHLNIANDRHTEIPPCIVRLMLYLLVCENIYIYLLGDPYVHSYCLLAANPNNVTHYTACPFVLRNAHAKFQLQTMPGT